MKQRTKHLDRLTRHVKRLVKRRYLTQKDLAIASGLSEADIHRILHGVDVRYSKGAILMSMKP